MDVRKHYIDLVKTCEYILLRYYKFNIYTEYNIGKCLGSLISNRGAESSIPSISILEILLIGVVLEKVHSVIINLPLFSTVLQSNSRLFLSCRPFIVNATFSSGLADVVLTTKSLQDRNNLLLDGRTVENKGKLIITEIFPSVKKHDV